MHSNLGDYRNEVSKFHRVNGRCSWELDIATESLVRDASVLQFTALTWMGCSAESSAVALCAVRASNAA